MEKHKREIVGKFLHSEEMMGTSGKSTMRPSRIRSVCGGSGERGISGYCAEKSVRALAIKGRQDKCMACRGVAADAEYVLRRSKLGSIAPSVLKKKKLELFDLLEPLCNDM